MIDFIQQKIDSNNEKMTKLLIDNEELKQQKENASKKNGLEKWEGFTFESSSGLTDEFASFSREFKKHIQKICGSEYQLVNFSRGHFEVSGFIKRNSNGKMVYFSTSDVRFSQDNWLNGVLVRTAENEKDYTGGSNNFYSLGRLNEAFDSLTN